MSAPESGPGVVTARDAVVEVRGVEAEDVIVAMRLFRAAHDERRTHVAAFGASLLTAMVTADLDIAPHAAVEQVKRSAALRASLLAGGAYSYAALASLRSVKESSLRTWVTRLRDRRELFVVKHDGRALVPAFLLDEAAEPRPELAPVIAQLVDAGEGAWGAWSWLCSPSSLLSGGVPEELARTAPERVVRAARRRVAQRAPRAS